MSLVQEIIYASGTCERSEPTDWLTPTPQKILASLRRLRVDRRAALRAIGEEVTTPSRARTALGRADPALDVA